MHAAFHSCFEAVLPTIIRKAAGLYLMFKDFFLMCQFTGSVVILFVQIVQCRCQSKVTASVY